MSLDAPLVSVVTPVYNGEAHLVEAIESVRTQTFRDFEHVIVDDGSADGTPAILAHYQQLDPRIRVIRQENQGIPATRNRCWQAARGKYIAWADADDICLPQRLATQVEFLEAHPDIGICGSWIEVFSSSWCKVWQYPTDDATIRCRLLFESMFANPSVMMRRSIFAMHKIRYESLYPPAEDYQLWTQAAKYTRFANLPMVLVKYRQHETQNTKVHHSNAVHNAQRVRRNQLEQLGLSPTSAEMDLHRALAIWQFEASRSFVKQATVWSARLLAANRLHKRYPEPTFSQVVAQRWLAACFAASSLGLWTWIHAMTAPRALDRAAEWSIRRRLGLARQCFKDAALNRLHFAEQERVD